MGTTGIGETVPALSLRIAAGKLLGSDVLGADDAISRDHNWGPQFWLFLNDTDYTLFGQPLAERLNNAAPNPWKGYRLDGAGDKAVEVFSLTRFMKDVLSLDAPPQNTRDWVSVGEYSPRTSLVASLVLHQGYVLPYPLTLGEPL